MLILHIGAALSIGVVNIHKESEHPIHCHASACKHPPFAPTTHGTGLMSKLIEKCNLQEIILGCTRTAAEQRPQVTTAGVERQDMD